MGLAVELEGVPNVVDEHGTVWYSASCAGRALGLSNIRVNLQKVPRDEKRCYPRQTPSGVHKATFIALPTLTRLVCLSRKPQAMHVASELGVDVLKSHVPCMESQTLHPIMLAFAGERMETQYRLGDYQVDLYFPQYAVVVECDELEHTKGRCCTKDAIRQTYLETVHGCVFVRYKPHDPGFCIFRTINQIYHALR